MTPDNPLLQPWTAPHGLPPFQAILPAHFEPAFAVAMQAQRDELRSITHQAEAPDFDNTVAAFDRSGRLLGRVAAVFYNLTASQTNPELQAVQRRMAAPLADHDSAIFLDEALFARIDALHAGRDALGLSAEQRRLLERVHLDFVRAGARLQGAARARYAAVMSELADLTTRFAQNVLHDESSWRLELRSEADLAGLPDFVRASARQAAAGTWPARRPRDHAVAVAGGALPDLQPAARPARAGLARLDLAGRTRRRADNREVARHPAPAPRAGPAARPRQLRRPRAGRHHGRQPQRGAAPVRRGLAARPGCAADRASALQAQKVASGGSGPIEAWDWRYWAEQVRQARYAVDDAEVKPYFRLEAMVQAAFDCAGACSACASWRAPDLPVYHPDVKAYEVQRRPGPGRGPVPAGQLRAPSKRSGAWMSSLRWQNRNAPDAGAQERAGDGRAAGDPEQQQLRQGRTGRAHAAVAGRRAHAVPRVRPRPARAACRTSPTERLSGTQVLRDFVELPSQLFEHWLSEPAVLRAHARHWKTGEPMPEALMQRLQAARRFNQGYETVRYTASAMADMAVHARTEPSRRPTCAPSRPTCCATRACRRPWARTTAWCTSSTCSRARLCRRLLRLPVGRGAGRRRLRRLPRGRRPLRPCAGAEPAALHLRQWQQPGAGRGLRRLPRPGAHRAAAAAQARAGARGRDQRLIDAHRAGHAGAVAG
jgi:peptidyl-dipeptidase Dcp